MLSIAGWTNGLSALFIVLFSCSFGSFCIYKSRQTSAKLLLAVGLNIIFTGLCHLGFVLDFFSILLFGVNLENSFGQFGILSLMWLPVAIIISSYIGSSLLLPKIKRYVLIIIGILCIIYEIFLFSQPFDSIKYSHPVLNGRDLMDARVILMSPVGLITIIFIFVNIIFLGFGYLYKGIKSEGILRSKFFCLSIAELIYSILSSLEAFVSLDYAVFFIRFGLVNTFYLLYFGLSETPLYPDKEHKEIIVADSLLRLSYSREYEENLREINRLKSELLNRTSHELKTPLISIKGYVELLLLKAEDQFDSDTLSYLNEVYKGCLKFQELIDNLLNVSQIESGRFNIQSRREDLSFLIEFTVNELKGLINIRGHALKLDIQKPLFSIIEKEKIHQVISNLLTNAVKFSMPNGKIEISAKEKKDEIKVCIEDSGIGIMEENKKFLFKKFGKIERFGKGWDIISEGPGLGLFISKEIIELHGGKLWVESKGRGKGAKFCFTLPRAN
ncbi:MAG: hypothetical protein GF383_01205 [Candidatus Lokiarchaeota archaeon]|nr:hypothetical protein [Candidatus Lokiarchaeota archaeon]MBD3337867.1 hypothetical protein [Candidatus Lokiarchaeota archaeon]